MKKIMVNYETLIKVIKFLTQSKDPFEIIQTTVENIQAAFDIKGCALFLIDHASNELKVAASYGLSSEYLEKGPVSTIHSIGESLTDGPVAIYDVTDDPRIQYPEAAKKEGIASILSIPIMLDDKAIGAIRVYSAEPWEFTLDDVNFIQALAQIVGVLIDRVRLYQGKKNNIEMFDTTYEGSLREYASQLEGEPTTHGPLPKPKKRKR